MDQLGGLDDAIKLAAREAKLKEGGYRVRYPVRKTFWQQFMDKTEDEAEARTLKGQFGEFAPYVKQFQQLKSMEGLQARMPFLTVE